MNEKIALVLPANIWFCPYLNIYTDLFKKWDIPYCIICWDKDGKGEGGDNVFSFCGKSGQNPVSKLYGYYRFAQFAKKCIEKSGAGRVVVFTSQAGIFLSSYLQKRFPNKYIFDLRDLSIEQSLIFRRPFETLVANSYSNVISSPGYRRYLPGKYTYVQCHNFVAEEVKKGIGRQQVVIPEHPIEILTIGGIRNFESNAELMDSLANTSNFLLRFVGKGPSAIPLKEYANKQRYNNVKFEGYYNKEDEPEYVKSATFINIYCPPVASHSSLLSNRFYLSLIYRRPMIVNKGHLQGNYCKKYNLGVEVSDPTQVPHLLEQWLKETDIEEYDRSCRELLEIFIREQSEFAQMLRTFVDR